MAAALAAGRALGQAAGVPPYQETYRPRFHFSPQKGWTNDPNGLVFYKGEYHLFFQHNPLDTKWGNMTWGHAVSSDLVHWKQLASAIEPDRRGTIFSGSAVVDEDNTAGFQEGVEKTLVCIYTSAGGTSPASQGQPFTQNLAYSNDRGRTWTKYSGNPVVPHVIAGNRDPKVVWHAPAKRWIMVFYLDGEMFRFLSSPDLKTWTTLHDIVVPGCGECPDFFEMAVDGEPGLSQWVWTAANDHYLIGAFDGRRFVPEVMTNQGTVGGNYYAVQTYSGLPDGRRVQLAWMKGGVYPNMPFNQQMSFPYELKLRRFGTTLKLCALPVREIQSIQHAPKIWTGLELKAGENPLSEMLGDLWDIHAEIDPGDAAEVAFSIRGRKIAYTIKSDKKDGHRLSNGDLSAVVSPRIRPAKIRILVDRTTVEVFGNDGEIVMPACFLPQDDDHSLKLFSTGGAARIVSLKVYPLESAWN